jgi:hypothetical protein
VSPKRRLTNGPRRSTVRPDHGPDRRARAGARLQEREQLEKEAPALAKADLRKERIAIAGVVSDAPTVGDSTASRESWAVLIGDHFGRERFGKLPIVAVGELRTVLGREDYT